MELRHDLQWSYGTIANRVLVVYEGYGTISSGAMVQWSQSCSSLRELWHNFQWSYGTIIIELRLSTRVIVQFPVELWYDGHRVAVVYKSYGMMIIDFW